MTEHIQRIVDESLPQGGPPILRWAVFLANQFGVPFLLLIAFGWFIVAQNADHRQERAEDAARLAQVNGQVLQAFQQNAAATTLQANAILSLNNSLQENMQEMRRYQDVKMR